MSPCDTHCKTHEYVTCAKLRCPTPCHQGTHKPPWITPPVVSHSSTTLVCRVAQCWLRCRPTRRPPWARQSLLLWAQVRRANAARGCRCHQRVQPRMRHRTGACGLAYMRRAEGWEEREIVRAFAAGGRCPCAHVSARLCERMRHGSRARERRMACGEHDANAVARYARQRCWRLGGWGHTCPRPPSPRTRLFH